MFKTELHETSVDGQFDRYQQLTQEYANYPTEHTVHYLALGLVGEAGECANKVKKVLRGDKPLEAAREDIMFEVGDTLWYAAQLLKALGYPMSEAAQANIDKLALRKQRNTLKGEGDAR